MIESVGMQRQRRQRADTSFLVPVSSEDSAEQSYDIADCRYDSPWYVVSLFRFGINNRSSLRTCLEGLRLSSYSSLSKAYGYARLST